MEKTLNLPDELVDRLSRREEQLGRILELGLRVVEREDGTIETDDDELPVAWRGALAELMSQRRRDSEEPPPLPEELIAYHRGELHPDEEERWLERLTLHPEAVRDLADLVEFDRDEAPSTRELQEATEALQDLRAQIDGRVSNSRRYRWIAVAAVLTLIVGVSWMPWLLDRGREGKPTVPRYAAVIDVAASRGARPFPVSQDAQEILLILPLETAAGAEQGTLRITAVNGDEIYRDTFRMTDDRWSRLYVSLPHDRLRPGSYRIEITTPAPNARTEAREYRFAIEAPAQR